MKHPHSLFFPSASAYRDFYDKPSPLRLPRGFTYRSAASNLGVSHVHLYLVMKGDRQSAALITRAKALFADNKNKAA